MQQTQKTNAKESQLFQDQEIQNTKVEEIQRIQDQEIQNTKAAEIQLFQDQQLQSIKVENIQRSMRKKYRQKNLLFNFHGKNRAMFGVKLKMNTLLVLHLKQINF